MDATSLEERIEALGLREEVRELGERPRTLDGEQVVLHMTYSRIVPPVEDYRRYGP